MLELCDRTINSVKIFFSLFTGRNEVVAKVMFLQVCVCPQGGGCLPQCMLGCHTPPGWRNPPLDGEPPPDQADPPWMENPPQDQADPPWMENPPRDQADPPPLREADSSIRSTSGWYASYWNAFLLCLHVIKYAHTHKIDTPVCTVLLSCKSTNGYSTRN